MSKIVPVRPKLIIAGEEPENTNKFLQMLAHAAKNQEKLPVPWKKAVAIVQSGKFPDVTADRVQKKKEGEVDAQQKVSTEDSEKDTNQDDKKQREDKEKLERQEREKQEREKQEREKQEREKQERHERERERQEREQREREKREKLEREQRERQEKENKVKEQEQLEESKKQQDRARAEAQKRIEDRVEYTEQDRPISNRQPLARPQSVRGGRPTQNKTYERPITREDTDSAVSARGIIGDEDEENENLIIQEENSDPTPKTIPITHNEEAGGLMQQLQKKTELQQGQIESNQAQIAQEQKPKTKGVILKRKTDKSEDGTHDDIEKLRKHLQAICSNSDPLGKNLDYIQEDLEAMSRELSVWSKERKTYLSKLSEEKSKTEQLIKPLKNSISEVEDQIREKRDKIQAIKSQILKNDEHLNSMLLTVIGRD